MTSKERARARDGSDCLKHTYSPFGGRSLGVNGPSCHMCTSAVLVAMQTKLCSEYFDEAKCKAKAKGKPGAPGCLSPRGFEYRLEVSPRGFEYLMLHLLGILYSTCTALNSFA